MHLVVTVLPLLLIYLNTSNAFNLDSRNDPASFISRYQRCQRYGDKILMCATLQAAISARNEWTNFKQIILDDATLKCNDCKLLPLIQWRDQYSHILSGSCGLPGGRQLNLQSLKSLDLHCEMIDSGLANKRRLKRAGIAASSCDFRSNFCQFSQEKRADDLDWSRVSGFRHDGTTGYYAYLASSPALSDHFAQLLSPIVELPNNVQEFRVLIYYKLYGSGVDELAIFAGLNSNRLRDIWVTKSKSNSWLRHEFPFTPRQRRTRIILDGVLGPGHGGQIDVGYILIAPYETNCYTGNGIYYRGTISTTMSGYNCQSWTSNTPHKHNYSSTNYPDDNLIYNRCRNPSGKRSKPWCFTTNARQVWEYCNIAPCSGTSSSTHSTTANNPVTLVPTTQSAQLSNHASGIVTVKAHGSWKHLCAENLSNNTANVVCHQMGYYASASHYSESLLGQQSNHEVATYNCSGLESSIELCNALRSRNGSYICNNPKSVAGIICKQSTLNSTSCNFDTGYCGWSQPQRNLRMDWIWKKDFTFPGTSVKRTDPSVIVYTGFGTGPDQAILRSPVQNFKNAIISVKFKYYISSHGCSLSLQFDETNEIIQEISETTNGAWLSFYSEILPNTNVFTISFVVRKTSSFSSVVGIDDVEIVGITLEPFRSKCIRATVASAWVLLCVALIIYQFCRKKPVRRRRVFENPPTYDQVAGPTDESPVERDDVTRDVTTNRINDNMHREQINRDISIHRPATSQGRTTSTEESTSVEV